MAIEFRTSRGRRLPWLYGRFYIKNHSHVVNTGVRWRGIPPVSLLDSGDPAFEESRAAAKIALSAIAARRRRCRSAARASAKPRPGGTDRDQTAGARHHPRLVPIHGR